MIFALLSWLGLVPTFQKTKCKKLLSTTMERIKLLRSQREAQLRQLLFDVAKLLQLGKEQKAQVRIGRICKELCLLSVYRKISAYCESVQSNLKDIAGQDDCPKILEESVAGLCFAASCCADLPELQELREMFAMKYGKKFVTSAQDLETNCHVNPQFLECLYAKDPSDHLKQELLEEIIAQYKLKQGDEQALQQHQQDIELLLDAHGCNPCPIQQQKEVGNTAFIVETGSEEGIVEETSTMHQAEAISTVYEEGLGTMEVAQELAHRKKAPGSKHMRSSPFKRACNKRREACLNKNKEEDTTVDASNATMNAPEGQGSAALMRKHEAANKHVMLNVEKPSFSSPPQRPPPPPPPSMQAVPPPPQSPPHRAPPTPPVRSNSMPSFQQYFQHEMDHSEVPHPFRRTTMATKQYNQSFDWTHVHPRLPNYEDLVASFTAMKH